MYAPELVAAVLVLVGGACVAIGQWLRSHWHSALRRRMSRRAWPQRIS